MGRRLGNRCVAKWLLRFRSNCTHLRLRRDIDASTCKCRTSICENKNVSLWRFCGAYDGAEREISNDAPFRATVCTMYAFHCLRGRSTNYDVCHLSATHRRLCARLSYRRSRGNATSSRSERHLSRCLKGLQTSAVERAGNRSRKRTT